MSRSRSGVAKLHVGIPVPQAESAGTARAYGRRVVALAHARWRPFVVFCIAFFGFNLFRSYVALPFDDPAWGTGSSLNSFEYHAASVPLMFAALVLSEALDLHGVRHVLASLCAMAVATALAIAGGMWLYGGLLNRWLVAAGVIVSDWAFIARTLWFNVAGAMLLVAYFAFREREAASVRLAQAAQTERLETERATMAARLKVMQARVEPELLFGVLTEVRHLYERDPAAADALLDDMIAYLRAALPQMRGESSTLGREVDLALAYLRVAPASREARLAVDVAVPDSLRELAFPPMVLLPIVHAAVETGVATLRFAARGERIVDENRLPVAVTIFVEGGQLAGFEERLQGVRGTWAGCFGADGSLLASVSAAMLRAELRWHARLPAPPVVASAARST